MTKEEYDTLEESEYMIDDILVTATPINFGDFCENYNFSSNEYSLDTDGYDVEFNYGKHIFMSRELFEAISIKSEY